FIFCGTGILPVHKRLIDKGATYELQRLYNSLPNRHPSATGKMPVKRENLYFVEQASCLFIKG
ncbi:hypothetical protein QUB76_20140, partial [Microcoleus sp. D2B6]|uniref:hypothetical protein n=1 Tax=Microcoleus sp. D2B6 TaxID=3055331 RepID=UPI002FD31DE6